MSEFLKSRTVLQPPGKIDPGPRSIFLAGPIQGAPLWQDEAIEIIHDIDPTIVLANPRKEYRPGEFVYNDQVDWETFSLGRAGVKLFWLAPQVDATPGRAYGQTTRWELSEWTQKHIYAGAKIVVGVEESGFGNERYIRRRLRQDAPDIPICDSLSKTCAKAIQLLN